MSTQHFFFRKDGVLKKINLDEIIYIEAADNYARFYTSPVDFIMVRTSLDAAMSLFPENMFMRISRSYAVAIAHINTIARDEITLTSVPGESFTVSRKCYSTCKQQITVIEAATSFGAVNRNNDDVNAKIAFYVKTTWEDDVVESPDMKDIKKIIRKMRILSTGNEGFYIAHNESGHTLQITDQLDAYYFHNDNVDDHMYTMIDSLAEAEELCTHFLNSNFDKVESIIYNKNNEPDE